MLSDLTFGQYYEAQSFVHKLDPRLKILLLMAFVVLVFVANSFYALLSLAVLLVMAIIFSKVPPLQMVRSLKAVLFIILFTVVLNIFFYKTETQTVLFWIITKEALIFSAFMAIRLVTLIMASVLLTYTTTPVALTDGIESLLSPLRIIKFPVHEIALVMSIALRFIPILMNEADRIIMAQTARGADFQSGNLFKKAKAMIPVLIPLLISAFRRAEELGDAMDSRCYSCASKRTKFKKLKFTYRDIVATAVSLVAFALVILIKIYGVAVI
ncbi:MAG: energy-coupling factor transporter transmembrane protein EcfT [Clostridia bacterium]|nr:energy-coupling factor transporter transmembrane protein EcfT [Clostridia bacterium]